MSEEENQEEDISKEDTETKAPERQEAKEEEKPRLSKKQRFKKSYNKIYKLLLIIPIILFIISLGLLGYTYFTTGDFIKKDISLTGGTSITVFTQQEINLNDLENYLSKNLEDFAVKELSEFRTGKQKAIIVESKKESSEVRSLLEEFLGYELTSENSSIESTGSALGSSFYNQLRFAILISFILMAIVVFVIFRTMVPSFAVVISAFADITMTLATLDLLGMKVSGAGIVALLMLIGYSVDSDIMLTTRLLKRHEEIDAKLASAFKTGVTMTLTSIIALTVALVITSSFSNIL